MLELLSVWSLEALAVVIVFVVVGAGAGDDSPASNSKLQRHLDNAAPARPLLPDANASETK
jgi:hypothetical protein